MDAESSRHRSWWRFLPRGGGLPPEVWAARHRGISVFAWLHVPVCSLIMSLEGIADPVATAGLVTTALLALAGSFGSQQTRATAVTGSLLVSTALLIHLFNGLIEVHFHFFVVIAVVAMYQSWTPYLVGLGYVLAHHAIMGLWMPEMVYNHPLAIEHPLLFAGIHGGFVLAEAVACLTYWKVNENALDAERRSLRDAEAARAGLEEANGQVADLLAMMSHDLRTPVAIVSGYGDMLLDSWEEIDEDSRRSFVDKMTTAGRTLDQMLSETLTLAALDTDGFAPTPTAVEMPALVREIVESTLPDDADSIELALSPSTAYVDRGQLRQIVANLLTNAVKYGALPLEVSVAPAGTLVELRVCDSGPGVPTEFVPQLFERWSRADQARSSSVRGTGLGLHIVRELTLGNGGDVRYEVTASGGACFVVTLPAANHTFGVPDPRQRSTAAGPASQPSAPAASKSPSIER
ncbi:HAMP domain-containing histidine kinase [Nocardioidaceae bacterium]|nr:HAMP domain-containing histidine kinase [Nocardioidaceae bacterium]